MKTLKEYLTEDLFDDSENLKQEILDWILEHYASNFSDNKSSILNPNLMKIDMTTNPPTVNYKSRQKVSILRIKDNTNNINNNGMFQWGDVNVNSIVLPDTIEDLNGLPKVFSGSIHWNGMSAPGKIVIKSLQGCPEEIGGSFDCHKCENLTSLEGAPKKVGVHFMCYYCKNLKSLKGAPEEVGGKFDCHGCEHLTSLKGAPKEVGGSFDCSDCGVEFTEEDVNKVSSVGKYIYC